MEKVRALFMGTPDFAVPCLAMLHEKHSVIGVVTQPDRPKGRGQKLMPSPVKQFALEQGLQIYQPIKVKTAEFESLLKQLHPDLVVVVAFGQILSETILSIPPLGCINVHASLLPQYRGAAPIHWSVINGEKITGITTMFMDTGLDTGDMILKSSVEIGPEDTTGKIHDRLMLLGANLLDETLQLLIQGKAPREKQQNDYSSYAPLLSKEIERIHWDLSARQIHDLVRGLCPWPGAYCLHGDKILKINKTNVSKQERGNAKVGEVVKFTSTGFLVATTNGLIEILELQPANKKKMSARDYINGNGIKENDILL